MPVARRRLLRFALVLVPSFALLAWPFPWVGRACATTLCWSVNKWIMTDKDTRDVPSLERDIRPGYEWHVAEVVWNRPTNSMRARFEVDFHQTLYLPIMLFVALSVAGRAAFGNKHFRLRLELLGLALLVARALLRFILLERWTDGQPHEGPFDMFLQLLQLAVAAPRGMAVAIPLLLWLLLSRRALIAATA
jgi:hypothetical protein